MPINSTGFIKIPQDYAIKPVQKKDEESKQNLFVDKSLSQSAKYMIGATALAGVVALGIIGHRNNWWTNAKKVVQQESVKNSAEAAAQPVKKTSKNPNKTIKEINPTQRTINKINAELSKETKHAKRALRQYNEIYTEFNEVCYRHGSDYVKYLKENKIPFEAGKDGIRVFDKEGKLTRIIKGLDADNKISQTYIEYYDKNGKLAKIVSFVDNTPSLHFYDNNGNLSKRIVPISKIGGTRPSVMTAEFKNNRLTKEAIYIQPMDNNYDNALVLKVINHKKATEYGAISVGSKDKYAILSNKRYELYDGNELKEIQHHTNGTIIVNDSFNSYRYYLFNSNNEIVRTKELMPGWFEHITLDSKTGNKSSGLSLKNGKLDDYIEYDPNNGQPTRKIFEAFDHETMFMDIPFINGKGDMAQAKYIKKSDFDVAPFLERYKLEHIK